MFETTDRTPAGVQYAKKKEPREFFFVHEQPIAEYYRPEQGSAPLPADRAPDRYSLTSEYLIRSRPIREPGAGGGPGWGAPEILCIEGNLRIAIEREAARIRWAHKAGRWPGRKDIWRIRIQGNEFAVECLPFDPVPAGKEAGQ